MLAEGQWVITPLDPVGEPQTLYDTAPPEASRAPAGTVWRVGCMPGGTSDEFATERATGHLWRVTVHHPVRAPEGVLISATRCTAQAVRLPAGGIRGVLRVAGS